ncbi:hypothetical protein FOL47_000776, partial [Perkinsus chesapeaki]
MSATVHFKGHAWFCVTIVFTVECRSQLPMGNTPPRCPSLIICNPSLAKQCLETSPDAWWALHGQILEGTPGFYTSPSGCSRPIPPETAMDRLEPLLGSPEFLEEALSDQPIDPIVLIIGLSLLSRSSANGSIEENIRDHLSFAFAVYSGQCHLRSLEASDSHKLRAGDPVLTAQELTSLLCCINLGLWKFFGLVAPDHREIDSFVQNLADSHPGECWFDSCTVAAALLAGSPSFVTHILYNPITEDKIRMRASSLWQAFQEFTTAGTHFLSKGILEGDEPLVWIDAAEANEWYGRHIPEVRRETLIAAAGSALGQCSLQADTVLLHNALRGAKIVYREFRREQQKHMNFVKFAKYLPWYSRDNEDLIGEHILSDELAVVVAAGIAFYSMQPESACGPDVDSLPPSSMSISEMHFGLFKQLISAMRTEYADITLSDVRKVLNPGKTPGARPTLNAAASVDNSWKTLSSSGLPLATAVFGILRFRCDKKKMTKALFALHQESGRIPPQNAGEFMAQVIGQVILGELSSPRSFDPGISPLAFPWCNVALQKARTIGSES